MAATADLIYPRLLDATGLTPIAFEKKVGLGNGVVARAIANRSALRAGTIALLMKAFPQLDSEFLETGSGHPLPEAGSKGSPRSGTAAAEPATVYAKAAARGAGRQQAAPELWKDKYLSLLERQVVDQDVLLKTANAAIEAAAETTGLIRRLPAEYVSLRVFGASSARIDGFRQFAIAHIAQLSGKPEASLQEDLVRRESAAEQRFLNSVEEG